MVDQAPFLNSTSQKLKKWLQDWKRESFLRLFPVGSSCCLQTLDDLILRDWNQSPELMSLKESPELCDILIIGGNITQKYKPYLLETCHQMSEDSKIVLLGNCAINGGPYQDIQVIKDLSSIIKVDLVIPGCPPPALQIYESLSRLLVKANE